MIYKFYDQDSNILEVSETSEGYVMFVIDDHTQPATILEFSPNQLYEIIGCLLNIQKKIQK